MGNIKRYAAYGGILVLLGLCVYKYRLLLKDLLTVAFLSLLMTAMLSPVCAALEKRGMSSSCAAAFSLIAVFGAIFLALAAFMPYLVLQSADLIKRSLPALNDLYDSISSRLVVSVPLFLERAPIPELVGAAMGKLTSALAGLSLNIASKTGLLFFSLIIVYYTLKDRQILFCHVVLFVPSMWRSVFLSAMQSCMNACMSYLSAMAKTSLFVAGITYPALLLLNVPNALLLSILMGLFEILPYIGPIIAAIPILLSCLPMGIHTVLAVLVVLILIQQIEGSLITPYFTASSTSMHPLAALISVFVFGRLWGIIGILLAVPAVMIARNMVWSFRQACNLMKT